MKVFLIEAVLSAVFLVTMSVGSSEPLVDLPAGTVRGTVVDVAGTQVNAYLGIPYAKPPVGELRFKPPVPPDPWEGVYNATKFSNRCYQLLQKNQEDTRSEDCLYLNVWQRRSGPPGDAVMVWIHGGGFRGGAGSMRSVSRLVTRENIILVSMNYRVGALGFLALGTDDAPGNMGLLDQKLALQWVQENIERFGGNPDRVTIFGSSAGGASVGLQLLSPSNNGLFRRVILQSGAAFCAWALTPNDVAAARGRTLAESLGCWKPKASDTVRCLRDVTASDIVDRQSATDGFLRPSFTPVVYGKFLPNTPDVASADPPFTTVDMIAGYNTNEGMSFLLNQSWVPGFSLATEGLITKEEYIRGIQSLIPELNEFGVDAVAFHYMDWAHISAPETYRDAMESLTSDFSFKCPVVQTVDAHARSGGARTYLYQFDHRKSTSSLPPWTGVLHSALSPFVSGSALDPESGFTAEEHELARRVMRFWANFARTGDPNDPGNDLWPVYNQTDQSYIVLDTQPVRVAQWPRARPCAFWREYLWPLEDQTDELMEATVSGGASNVASGLILVLMWTFVVLVV
ncbi:acetylcholinesterase-like [Branchiostoma lanceolatum]|uniref:acetylcholinesterase-like n=1 Tax=Branchiostoma lanceolatum TaxID=7740 RepID=UPI0034549128